MKPTDVQQETAGVLRSGRCFREQSPESLWQDKEEIEEEQETREATSPYQVTTQCPIVTMAQGQIQYVPWSFMDMVGLASRRPDLHEGANKWITALEESTAGMQLALGDIKALLMHIAGKHIYEEIFHAARLLPLVVSENRVNDVGFGGHRTQV